MEDGKSQVMQARLEMTIPNISTAINRQNEFGEIKRRGRRGKLALQMTNINNFVMLYSQGYNE